MLHLSRKAADRIRFAASPGLAQAYLTVAATAADPAVGAVGVAGTPLPQGRFGGFDTGNGLRILEVPDLGVVRRSAPITGGKGAGRLRPPSRTFLPRPPEYPAPPRVSLVSDWSDPARRHENGKEKRS
jgi:hypothetical protein